MSDILKNPKLFPFIVAGTFLFLFILYNIFSSAKPTTQVSAPFFPTPFQVPEITFSPTININQNEFSVIGVEPDISSPILYQKHIIQVIFNQELDPNKVFYSLSPLNKIHTNIYQNIQGQNLLEIVPLDPWKNLTYKLTINHNTKSKNGAILGKDVIIKFTVNTYHYKGI